MSAFTDAIARNMEGCEFTSVGGCPGCQQCGLSDEPSEDELQLVSEPWFSWSPCECCGSALGGDRYAGHFVLDDVIHHMAVCVDCLAYIANVEEPGTWEG